MIALAGFVLLHVIGALLRVLLTRISLRHALERPSSLWFAIVAAYCVTLGWAGFALGAALLIISRLGLTPLPEASLLRREEVIGFVLLAGLVLARPLTPTQWDEFVWIAKARLESLGFGGGVRAALDPTMGLIPPGYPPLWPASIGWLSLHVDDIGADVLSGSLLMLTCVATLIEVSRGEKDDALAPWPRGSSAALLTVLFASPLIWVHLRSTYVDLPVGLLSASLAVCLLRARERPSLLAVVLAVVLASFKDEGLLHVFAATAAGLAVHGLRKWRLGLPALAAVFSAALWKLLLHLNDVSVKDHAVGALAFGEAANMLKLIALHMFDLHSWGIFWAFAFAALVLAKSELARGLRIALLGLFVVTFFALLAGPERVRVFAENGTLLNRLLLQLWPTAALLIASSWPKAAQPSMTR
jgi:hypothetical protein